MTRYNRPSRSLATYAQYVTLFILVIESETFPHPNRPLISHYEMHSGDEAVVKREMNADVEMEEQAALLSGLIKAFGWELAEASAHSVRVDLGPRLFAWIFIGVNIQH
ncbi:hypothetical protein J6590_062337 [Homalodisca vitripennis]|nr:hypothetical protein J6590_062337 [Homalodisca vitripennis]